MDCKLHSGNVNPIWGKVKQNCISLLVNGVLSSATGMHGKNEGLTSIGPARFVLQEIPTSSSPLQQSRKLFSTLLNFLSRRALRRASGCRLIEKKHQGERGKKLSKQTARMAWGPKCLGTDLSKNIAGNSTNLRTKK